jgi:phage-related protein
MAPSLALILSLPNGIEGAKVTRIRTLARYIDGVNFPGGTNPLGTRQTLQRNFHVRYITLTARHQKTAT